MTTRKITANKPRQPEKKPDRWELVDREQKVRDVVIRIARRLANEKK